MSGVSKADVMTGWGLGTRTTDVLGRMRSSPHLGLKGRALIFCVLLLAGTVGTLSTSLSYLHHRTAVRNVHQQAMIQAKSIGRTAEPDILLNDAKGLQRLLQATGEAGQFRLGQITDPEGKILARSGQSPPGGEPELPPVSVRPRQPDAFLVTSENEEVIVWVPVCWRANDLDLGPLPAEESEDPKTGVGVPIGYVCLSYSMAPLRAEMWRHLMLSAVISGGVILIGLLVTFGVVRHVLTPVEDLARTAAAIADGDLSKRASEDAIGEIGTLAESFNHMAETIRQYTESLEEQVHERTIELTDALRRAEAATLAKSEFLANMSHEIRTPLTAIMGYTDILIEESYSRAAQEPLGIVKRNGQHLLQIINDILDLSKIECGKMEIERVAMPLVGLIAEIKSLMQIRVEAKGLSFRIEYAGEIPETIESDPTRVRQILINLVGNAIKFTEAGGVRLQVRFVEAAGPDIVEQVSVTLDSEGEAGAQVRIRPGDPCLEIQVIDTGIGMDSEQIGRLFQPFSQGDTSMTRRFGGTGLGLAISRRLAQRLGGTVTVRSELGRGSTFTLLLATGPLEGVRRIAKPDDVIITESVVERTTEPPAEPKDLGARILLAEDGPDNQRLISFVLKKAGAAVVVAENGKVAVEMVRAAQREGRPFDLVLMDMQMPVLDGYGATGQLRRMGCSAPIIALTAHAMAGDKDKCLSAGCTDYATKPIDRRVLLDVIRRCLGNAASTAQATPSV